MARQGTAAAVPPGFPFPPSAHVDYGARSAPRLHGFNVFYEYANTVSVTVANDHAYTRFFVNLRILQNRFCLFIWGPRWKFLDPKNSVKNLVTLSL